MRCEIFDPLVGLGLFVGAVEILQRERHIVGQPLQQLDEFRRERVLLGGHENHDADHLPARRATETPRRTSRRRCGDGMECLAALVGEIVVDDAGLPRAERRAAQPAPFRDAASLTDDLHAARAVGGRPGGRHDVEIVAVGSAPARCVVEVNLPPCRAASHTSSNNSLRDLARMIASLVALSAANMRVRRSFCSSVLAFSSARSKLSSANDTLSASRCSSSTNSGVNASFSQGDEEHDADHLPAHEQRKAGAGSGAVLTGLAREMPRPADRPDSR